MDQKLQRENEIISKPGDIILDQNMRWTMSKFH